ncbi:phage tail tape measure C-terminal domain-containing protein [Profundibacter sp.]|uniref:phage tail tape measure C-terminal domain-containing protein n=1 Tax=Profundibacter sp. TaxID=3101071 RepID=UPI003D14272A
MAEKRVSVRLAAVGGKQVKAEFEGIGEAGKRGIGKVSKEAEIANARLARFARRAKIAAGIMAAAAVAAGIAMVRSSLQTIDEQAKLAASLRTTTASMQVLARAADLAGVSQGEVEQATIMMTKSLSQAAQGTGPAVKALDTLNLSAADLAKLPIDEKMAAIQDAIAKFIPTAQQAAVASQIFGSRAGLIFTRIDSATLHQATQDVEDFGVAVSESDAAQIQRTNDALSRMGLLWRGIANQLAVAAAPALESIANAMAVIGKTTGPLGRAIKGLFNHIGEIATIAATFAAVLGGRLVIALASAALGIKGVSISLVALRGALIIGAGELIYWFSRLVKGAGGFGEAMRLLKNVAIEVWERIKLGGKSLGAALSSVWARIKAGWLTMLANIQKTWTDFLHAMTRGISNIPGMDSAMLAIGNAAIMAGSAYYEMAATAEDARNAADGLVTSSREMAQAATAPLTSMQALRDAMKASTEDGESGLAGTTTAAETLSRAVTGAGGAARAAAEVAKTAWELAADSLKDYASKAANVGKRIGDALVGAFTSAENAIGEFVKTGKLDFSSLVTSMLADLAKLSARKFILRPLANALSGALGGLGKIFAPVLHAGGMVGGAAPQRMVPAMAFANAPRMHSGGWAGLKPNEVPAILQKGERVLSRREASQYGTGGSQNITINIQTRDAESFRQSRTQVSADIARAVAMGRRGM